MELAAQYYRQIDTIVASLLCTQQFHWQTLDQLEKVFVVLNLLVVASQLGFVDMYLRVTEEGVQRTNKKKEERNRGRERTKRVNYQFKCINTIFR